jgi:multiple RNA-binding domain-containing protein 1
MTSLSPSHFSRKIFALTTSQKSDTMTSSTEKPQDDANHEDDSQRQTTRVCMKNIPPNFTEEKLRQFLLNSSKMPLEITDCRILKTPSGKSRKLAFCGFVTENMAQYVVREFNMTYCRTCKLTVELAFNKKQAQAQQRPWSQYSVGSSRYQAKHPQETNDPEKIKNEKKKNKETSKDVDKKKEEFLAAMGASAKPWANDDAIPDVQEQEEQQPEKQQETDSSSSSSSDDSDSSNSDDDSDVNSVDSGGEGADALKSSSAASRRAPHASVVSDLEFLQSKVTAAENLASDDEDDDEANNDKAVPVQQEDDSSSSSDSSSSAPSSSSDDDDSDDDNNDVIMDKAAINEQKDDSKDTDSPVQPLALSQEDPHRLFVRNLPFSSTEEDLQQHFQQYGKVAACHVPVDDQKHQKGFAFVSFESSDDAKRAQTELDGTDFQGRLLHILPAKREIAKHSEAPGGDLEALTYKQKQELARQQNASSTKGWSASFVRGDAVVDNLADRLGLRKGDILNVKDGLSSGDAAVRLALGETHIIEENREYFRKEGIDMEALVSLKGDNSKRSTTALLVKNLPYETEMEELTKLFHGVGDAPQRILLPPSRTIAMVEYEHATDAKRAFRKLAYKRFKHVPLYLEWAPLAAKVEGGTKRAAPSSSTGNVSLKDDDGDDLVEEESAAPTVSHTIYVKNLNFITTEQELQRVFSKHVKSIRAVKIPTKAAPVKKVRGGGDGIADDNQVNHLSMGFGFVECDSEESVRKAIKALQGTIVDGHALELKRSSKAVASSVPKKSQGSNLTKLMVRNVPFQATRKELLQLFGSFGQLKKVRLPKKFDGTHRGFAFVEFLTHQEAQTAMQTLSKTHLYGRHLVLEWASDKEDLDTLREKAQRDVQDPPKNKKIRFE